MAIPDPELIPWQEVERSPVMARLEAVLSLFGDGELMEVLSRERGKGRDDYPVVPLWNSLLAGFVLRHETTAALIAELLRNAELRAVCGFTTPDSVPPDYVYSRFRARLDAHEDVLQRMFARLVARLAQFLPDLGKHLAADSKAVPTMGDKEAGEGVKTRLGEDGAETVSMSWNGYKLHLVCCALYELPLAFFVTAANEADSPNLLPLVERLKEENAVVYERAEDLAADKAYDDGEDKAALYDEHDIVPVIPSRNPREGLEYQALGNKRHDTIFIGPQGEVACRHDPFHPDAAQQYCAMQFQGYEQDRGTLKFRCPAAAFGLECKNKAACNSQTRDTGFGRVLRVPLQRDRRTLLPVHQKTAGFKERYARRTSIERVFSRLDNLFGTEHTRLRGKARITTHLTLALGAMLATALGWIQQGRAEHLRRTLQSPAARAA